MPTNTQSDEPERPIDGVIAPIATPFGDDGAPDADRFLEHADWLLTNGCDGLAPFGTTSEATSLGLDERMELLEELVDAGIDAQQLMPGTGSPSLADAVILTQHAVELGCVGCLMLPPYYYKQPTEEGLYRFFSELIEDVADDRLRVYLYHIPPIAQVGFTVPLIARLRQAYPDTIAGLKDSSGDFANTRAILEANPEDFDVFVGSEAFLLEGLRLGAAGTISASANVNPQLLQDLFQEWQSDGADKLQGKITAMRKALQSQPLVPLIKGIIAHYRDDRGWAKLRPPLIELPEGDVKAVIRLLEGEFGFSMPFDESNDFAADNDRA